MKTVNAEMSAWEILILPWENHISLLLFHFEYICRIKFNKNAIL